MNNSGLQKLTAEVRTGFDRLQSLLQIGQSVTARVLEVRPQPGPPAGRAAAPPPAAPTPARGEGTAGTAPRGPATGNPSTGNPSTDASGQQPAYRAKLAVQGRLLEIVTPRPLSAGTEVRLTRESSGQIQVRVPGPPALPGQPGAASPNSPSPASTGAAQPPAGQIAGAPPRSAPDPALLRLQVPLPRHQPDPGLRPGETLTARVVRVSVEPAAPAPGPTRTDAASYRVQLALPGRTLELPLPQPLPLDSQVKLRLNPGGTVTLEASLPRTQPLTQTPTQPLTQPPTQPLTQARTQALEQALRQHLPQQQPPHLLLNLLGEAQQGGQLQKAQPLLLNLVQLLLGRSLTPQRADAEGVRQQMLNSGTQLENRLARGDTQALQQDHKALLLRFNQVLQAGGQRELPPALGERLTQMTREAISRVLVNQVTSLGRQSVEPGSEAGRSLALDIPVLWQGQNETIKLRIERDPEKAEGEDTPSRDRWQVRLQFAIADLPPLGVELTLEGERISVIWQGEQDAGVRRLLGPHLDALQDRLETLGLEVGAIGIREASFKDNPREHQPPLIDIKT